MVPEFSLFSAIRMSALRTTCDLLAGPGAALRNLFSRLLRYSVVNDESSYRVTLGRSQTGVTVRPSGSGLSPTAK
jgi:hypothetical protein